MADNEIHREPHNPARIVQLFESAIAAKAHMDIYRYYQYAYALSESGRYDEANRLLSLLSKYPDNVKTYWWKYRINKIIRDTSDALKALETYCELSDSVVVAKLEQSVYKAQADHYALVSEIEKTNAQVSRLFVIITLLVSVIVLSALVIVFRGRKNRLIAEKEQLILQQEESNKMLDLIREREKREGKMAKLQISNLSMMNEDYKSKLNALREDFAKLYRKQFVDIQSLYAVNNNLETLGDRAIKKSAEKYSEIIAYLTNPEKQNALEDRLNPDLNGIMSKLRSDFKSFSEEQFRFLSYIILGFDTSSLAFLLDTTKNNVWVKKHRLKERIFNADTKNKELYQAFIQ